MAGGGGTGLDLVQPEYIAFQGGIPLRRVWSQLRVTNGPDRL
jgi:hypothetical protein